jgi:hypothetical protein
VAGCIDAPARPGVLPDGVTLAGITDLPSPERAAACVHAGARAEPASRAMDLRVIGYSRDGLVVAWRGRLLRASPGARNAVPIGRGEPLSAPFAPGSAASASGQYAVIATTEGVFVRDGQGHWKLWAPPELAHRYRQLTDLTVSDDGTTVAALLGGQLEILTNQRVAPVPAAP